MAREIVVRLTEPQAHALLHAVAYCTAGEPADWTSDDAAGWRRQETLDRAGSRLAQAMATRRRT